MRALRTVDDIAPIDQYFNGFHDGFVRSVLVRSLDRFVANGPAVTDIAHEVTGRFEAVIEFAHYNYDAGRQPAQRVVRVTCAAVRDIHLDLRPVRAVEWPITVAEFRPLSGTGAQRFALDLTWGRLDEGEWSTQQQTLWSFETATFEEIKTAGERE